jgi:hypothetical protein
LLSTDSIAAIPNTTSVLPFKSGAEVHGEGAVAVPVGNAFMAAPIRADEAKVLFIKWI